MIRAAISACAGNGLSFCRDRFRQRASADQPVRDRDAAVGRAVAAQAHRVRLRRGADRARMAGARADVGRLAAELAGVVPACCDGWVERSGAHRADVDGHDAGDDAADRGADDPDLCRNRRHGGTQTRAGGVAARFDRRLCRGLARLCTRCRVAAIRAGARGPARRRQRGTADRRHDLSRRRSLSILRVQAGLPDALPAAVSVLLFELDHGNERCVPARPAAGPGLSRLLLGDDAGDVRGRRDECGVDGGDWAC